jgi:hypothetical protein
MLGVEHDETPMKKPLSTVLFAAAERALFRHSEASDAAAFLF